MKISDIIGGNHPSKKNAKVVEGAPELLKAEMPLVRHIEKELAQYGYEKGTAEYDQHFKDAISMYRKFGNVDAIKKYHVEENSDPCWNGYEQIGMKEKDGKEVPNCVPTKEGVTEESETDSCQCGTEDAPVEVTAYYFDKDDRKHAGKISFKNENAARAWAAKKNAHILEMKLKK